MNLTGDPWIPVVYEIGVHKLVSLYTLYADAEKIRDLCVTPPQRIAVMRLLICITQRALNGPEDEKSWSTCKTHISSRTLEYLKQEEDKFELYENNPFLQVKDLSAEQKDCFKTRLDKFDIRLSCGHAHTLYDHRAASVESRSHADGWIALALLTLQNFALGGGQSTKAKWSKKLIDGSANGKKNNNFTAGPSAGSKLFTVLRGQSLLDSIHLNIIPKSHVKNAIPTASFGTPVWEDFPPKYESAVIDKRHRYTFLGRLVPLARFLRVSARDHRMVELFTNGLAYSETPDDFRDPMLTVTASFADGQESQRFLRIAPNKHPWREFYAIAARTDYGALALKHLDILSRSRPSQVVDVWVGGLLSNQGNPLEEAEWNFTFSAGSLYAIDLGRYEEGVRWASNGEISLKLAVGAYLEELSVSEFQRREDAQFKYRRNDRRSRKFRNNVFEKAILHFWGMLDNSYGKLLDICTKTNGNVNGQWCPVVFRALNQAYEYACPHKAPRQIQAFAVGRRELLGWQRAERQQSLGSET